MFCFRIRDCENHYFSILLDLVYFSHRREVCLLYPKKYFLNLYERFSFKASKYNILVIFLFSFWYVSLFPGRLGFDYSEMIRIIHRGESTAWWGAGFFWFVKITSLNGAQIFIPSLIGYITLTFAIHFFVNSLTLENIIRRRVILTIMATPFYGVFGVTVSHDVFQTSGIILFISLNLRLYLLKEHLTIKEFLILLYAIFCIGMTQTGIFISLFFIAMLVVKGNLRLHISFSLVLLSVIFYLVPNIGINENNKTANLLNNFMPMLLLADIKCVAQHPQAEITPLQWRYLESIAPIENWKKPVTCSMVDLLLPGIDNDISRLAKKVKLDGNLLKVYIEIVAKNPAIPFISHVQRSRVALPPPFFQPPENQITWDVRIPIGEGTNTALQSGPELLHPSIDEPSVANRPALLKPLEVLAQIPTLIINQSSWFWSWGGMWLWIILFYSLKHLKLKLNQILVIFLPLELLHASLFLIGPGSLGRYVMSSILLGIVLLIASIHMKLIQWKI